MKYLSNRFFTNYSDNTTDSRSSILNIIIMGNKKAAALLLYRQLYKSLNTPISREHIR